MEAITIIIFHTWTLIVRLLLLVALSNVSIFWYGIHRTSKDDLMVGILRILIKH